MEEWKEVKLGDVCKKIIAGGDASKFNISKNKTSENNIPVYANAVEADGLYGYCDKCVIDEPSVTVAARGAGTGFVCYRPIPYVPIVRLISLIPNEKVVPHFLYFYLKTKKLDVDGSAIPQLTVPMIKKESVYLPSIATQQKIASILSSLDDKIELNHRINENLEQQAQALFKSWFIDFEPFADGEYVESELGMIPKGWEVLQFKDFLEVSSEKALCTEYPEYSVTNNGIIPRDEKFKKRLSNITSKNKVLRKDDLVFGMSREILNWGIMNDSIGGVSSAYLVYHINKEIMSPLFLELFMKAKAFYFKDLIGTAAREGQCLDKGAMFEKNIYYPPKEWLDNFEHKYEALMNMRSNNLQESTRLAALRDTLLPKLMSGEIEL